jgi:hypothetical protein
VEDAYQVNLKEDNPKIYKTGETTIRSKEAMRTVALTSGRGDKK